MLRGTLQLLHLARGVHRSRWSLGDRRWALGHHIPLLWKSPGPSLVCGVVWCECLRILNQYRILLILMLRACWVVGLMIVGSTGHAFGCGVSIAFEGGVPVAAFATHRERFSAIHCKVAVLLTFEARAGDLDVLMCTKLGAKVLRAAHDEGVGSLRCFAEDLDVCTSLAWGTARQVLDPGCTYDRVRVKLRTCLQAA